MSVTRIARFVVRTSSFALSRDAPLPKSVSGEVRVTQLRKT